ncbi:unnamed protein product [Amoebophrya sp. A25]|nr:unnamed protein product [Amoebophrya sp. A25]|eukprot:GSA25T00010218001.1
MTSLSDPLPMEHAGGSMSSTAPFHSSGGATPSSMPTYTASQFSSHTKAECPYHVNKGRLGEQMDTIEAHNLMYNKPTLDGPGTSGIFSRFEARPQRKPSSKMILRHLPSATPEYTVYNYLQPSGLNDGEAPPNYHPAPDIRQTRFHRGFHRRHQSDIRQDAPRIQRERDIRDGKDSTDQRTVEGWDNYTKDYTFNLLSGEGKGRDAEFKAIGKRVVNPMHDYSVYDEHDKDQRNRLRQGMNRFFEYPPPNTSANRHAQLVSQGFLNSKPENVIIGYSHDAAPRLKMRSQGVADNFSHLQDASGVRVFAPVRERNKSQIVFG